ncbi:MAG: regulatory iron-sulfur-containing complex subunit RicT [Candidatus Ozemobacteraceae bacterium]
MSRYVSLRLRKLPAVHWHPESVLSLDPEQRVIVRTAHGIESAVVLRMLPEGRSVVIEGEPFVKEIMRVMEPADRVAARELTKLEIDSFGKARRIILDHKLPMRLLKAEYLFDQSRLILYYKSETKVDFRDLLKSLAGQFRTRIELRQIGVRDETRLLGGIGCCGKMVCCAQFMQTFHPVSTKMAKDQNLSLNPTKLSGICCRLLCCLAHEYEYYASFHGKFPKLGAEILIGTEKARVTDINYITQKLLVSYFDRRKNSYSLDCIKGRKEAATGRNLWWVQEPGTPEPDLSLLTVVPPNPKPVERSFDKAKEGTPAGEKSKDGERGSDRRPNRRDGPRPKQQEGVPTPESAVPPAILDILQEEPEPPEEIPGEEP